MCIVCITYELEKLTAREAKAALTELVNTTNVTDEELEHYRTVYNKFEEEDE